MFTSKSENDLFDVIIIGAGPFSMALGINYLKSGSSVLIIDEKKYAGGAWATRPVFTPESRHDVVAHLLSPFPESYALLEEFGFKLRPRPIHFLVSDPSEGQRITFDLLSDQNWAPVQSENSILVGWHQYYASLESNKTEQLIKLKQQECTYLGFKYFENNINPLINFLKKRYENYGGQFHLNRKVEHCVISNLAEVRTSRSIYTSSKLIIGRHFTGSVTVANEYINPNKKYNLYSSLLVQVSCAKLHAEYINFVNHPQIGAVQIEIVDKREGEIDIIICFIASFSDAISSEEYAYSFVNSLEQYGILIAPIIFNSEFYRLDSYSINKIDLDRMVSLSSGIITGYIVDSLMQNMTDEIKVWRNALEE